MCTKILMRGKKELDGRNCSNLNEEKKASNSQPIEDVHVAVEQKKEDTSWSLPNMMQPCRQQEDREFFFNHKKDSSKLVVDSLLLVG